MGNANKPYTVEVSGELFELQSEAELESFLEQIGEFKILSFEVEGSTDCVDRFYGELACNDKA